MSKDMAKLDNLTAARRLLELYYEGVATPGDVTALRRLLAETEPLPEDLVAECRLLDMLEGARQERESSIEVPEGLEASLRLNVHRMAAAERRVKAVRKGWLRRCGVAAAVLVGVGLAYNLYDFRDGLRHDNLKAYSDSVQKSSQIKEEVAMVAEAAATSNETPVNEARRTVASLQHAAYDGAPSDRKIDRVMQSEVNESSDISESTFTVSDREALALAISEMQQVSEDVFVSIRDDMDIASVETVSTFSDVQNTFMDDIYPSDYYSDSETIMEP